MDKVPLQDLFLAALCEDRVPVSIYLLNGTKLQGEIVSFDQFTVLLKNHHRQVIYKRLISTVIPASHVRIWPGHASGKRLKGPVEFKPPLQDVDLPISLAGISR